MFPSFEPVTPRKEKLLNHFNLCKMSDGRRAPCGDAARQQEHGQHLRVSTLRTRIAHPLPPARQEDQVKPVTALSQTMSFFICIYGVDLHLSSDLCT